MGSIEPFRSRKQHLLMTAASSDFCMVDTAGKANPMHIRRSNAKIAAIEGAAFCAGSGCALRLILAGLAGPFPKKVVSLWLTA
jgi:hypothetical protein